MDTRPMVDITDYAILAWCLVLAVIAVGVFVYGILAGGVRLSAQLPPRDDGEPEDRRETAERHQATDLDDRRRRAVLTQVRADFEQRVQRSRRI